MATPLTSFLRDQVLDRRSRLSRALQTRPDRSHLQMLLQEVDLALDRMDTGAYGLCEACHDPIEQDRLLSNPFVRLCLDHLTQSEQRALEQDLELASTIQRGLLPGKDYAADGWGVSYHYEPAGPVSGDYCDLVPGEDGGFHFIVGDVSGKGVAASMLMSHLHAMFRTLIPLRLPLNELVARASRVFCESTLPSHYATLVCGKAAGSGEIEICNAGHLPPILLAGGGYRKVNSSGMPIGLFCNEDYPSSRIQMEPGDCLFLYTDGLPEARNTSDEEFGEERLMRRVQNGRNLSAQELVNAVGQDLDVFGAAAPRYDDVSFMAIQRRRA